MKRCPQCLFLYPDADEVCDFDKARLRVISEAEIDAATAKTRKPRAPLVAAAGLITGVLAFTFYYAAVQFRTTTAAIVPAQPSIPTPVATPPAVNEASPLPAASPSPSAPTAKPSPTAKLSTSLSRVTSDPVSTSGPGMARPQGSKLIIVLTSGKRIEADEVWRTKDGVWYRRDGMVSLLKRQQVKSIVTR